MNQMACLLITLLIGFAVHSPRGRQHLTGGTYEVTVPSEFNLDLVPLRPNQNQIKIKHNENGRTSEVSNHGIKMILDLSINSQDSIFGIGGIPFHPNYSFILTHNQWIWSIDFKKLQINFHSKQKNSLGYFQSSVCGQPKITPYFLREILAHDKMVAILLQLFRLLVACATSFICLITVRTHGIQP